MSYSRFVNSPYPVLLLQHGGVRISPVDSSIMEIQCFFMELNENARTFPEWIPISEFGSFEVGRVVGDSVKPLKRKSRNREITAFVPDSSYEIIEDFEYRYRDPVSPKNVLKARSDLDNRLWVGSYSKNRLAVPAAEMARFQAAACSIAIDDIVSDLPQRRNPLEKYLDLNECEDLGDGGFKIRPLPSVRDASTVMQLAMIYTDPDFLEYWASSLNRLKAQRGRGSVPLFTDWLPSNKPMSFKAIIEPFHLSGDRLADSPTHIVRSITSDLREPLFKYLIIDLPHGFPDFEIGGEQRRDKRDREVPGERMGVTSRERPSFKSYSISPITGGFASAFPNIAKVPTEYRIPDPDTVKLYLPSAGGKKKETEKVSTLSPTKSGKIPGLRHRLPAARPPTSKQKNDRENSNFLDGAVDGALVSREIEPSALCLEAQSLLKVGAEIPRWVDQPLSPYVTIEQKCIRVFECPPSWSSWTHLTKDGTPRRLVALPLRTAGRFLWAIEIDRRGREAFSLGIVSPVDPHSDPIEFLTHVMHQVAIRKGRVKDTSVRGTWPSRIFADTAIANIIHTKKRRESKHMADTITARFLHMTHMLMQDPN